MKKWFKFFSLSFFSHKWSREGARHGYSASFLSFVLALIFMWAGFVGAEMLPFSSRYDNSPDFKESVRSVFANVDINKRIVAEIEDGILMAKRNGGEYEQKLLINTFVSASDKQNYSKNGYEIIVDLHPANALAEFEAYCVSNDGKSTVISYEEYLALSDAAKYNFDFILRYTGNELVLDDKSVEIYKEYLVALSDEKRLEVEKLADEISDKEEYRRAVYELYFTSYYPEITAYESSSRVPLLRNYYTHQYITEGNNKYLFIFDDCMAGSLVTEGGIEFTFYGVYSDFENGGLITEGTSQDKANSLVDNFIKDSYNAFWIWNAYAFAMNMLTFAPFIALMLFVAALLTYSMLKLCGIDSIASLGKTFKIVASYGWFSGVISAIMSIIIAFFVPRSALTVLPIVLFFAVLIIRSVIFIANESKIFIKQLKEQESEFAEE